jgi:hypothetical protein
MIKKYWNKPITWGNYAKLCGICYMAAIAISAASWAWLTKPWEEFMSKKNKVETYED